MEWLPINKGWNCSREGFQDKRPTMMSANNYWFIKEFPNVYKKIKEDSKINKTRARLNQRKISFNVVSKEEEFKNKIETTIKWTDERPLDLRPWL